MPALQHRLAHGAESRGRIQRGQAYLKFVRKFHTCLVSSKMRSFYVSAKISALTYPHGCSGGPCESSSCHACETLPTAGAPREDSRAVIHLRPYLVASVSLSGPPNPATPRRNRSPASRTIGHRRNSRSPQYITSRTSRSLA